FIGDRGGAKRGAGAALVLDDERLPEALLQSVRQKARQRVGATARSERHHDFHRARRIVLRGGEISAGSNNSDKRSGDENGATKHAPLHVMARHSRPEDGVASLAYVPAIPTSMARQCPMNRDGRHKAGHDVATPMQCAKSFTNLSP